MVYQLSVDRRRKGFVLCDVLELLELLENVPVEGRLQLSSDHDDLLQVPVLDEVILELKGTDHFHELFLAAFVLGVWVLVYLKELVKRRRDD